MKRTEELNNFFVLELKTIKEKSKNEILKAANNIIYAYYRRNIPAAFKEAESIREFYKTHVLQTLKDFNFSSDEDNEINSLFEELYSKSNSYNSLKSFIETIETSTEKRVFKSGLNTLDEALNGGFYAGLYVLGAISSIGKTTLALQIADSVAKSGRDVLYFSCEMGTEELQAKSISRYSYQLSQEKNMGTTFAQTTINILNGRFIEQGKDYLNHIQKSLERYGAECSQHLYFRSGVGSFGLTEIEEEIHNYKYVNPAKTPFIVIDYLQILNLESESVKGFTDKQRMDSTVIGLKKLATEYGIPILVISSINRSSYYEPISMSALKESGAIEYGADVVLGLQYKGMDYQSDEKDTTRNARLNKLIKEQQKKGETSGGLQEVELKVLKFRNGPKKNINLEFCPMFNFYKETENKPFEEF